MMSKFGQLPQPISLHMGSQPRISEPPYPYKILKTQDSNTQQMKKYLIDMRRYVYRFKTQYDQLDSQLKKYLAEQRKIERCLKIEVDKLRKRVNLNQEQKKPKLYKPKYPTQYLSKKLSKAEFYKQRLYTDLTDRYEHIARLNSRIQEISKYSYNKLSKTLHDFKAYQEMLIQNSNQTEQTLRLRIQELEAEVTTVRSENEMIRNQNTYLITKHDKLRYQLNYFKKINDYANAQAENNEILNYLKQDNQALKYICQALRDELDHYKNYTDRLRYQIGAAEDYMLRLRQETMLASERMQQCQDDLMSYRQQSVRVIEHYELQILRLYNQIGYNKYGKPVGYPDETYSLKYQLSQKYYYIYILQYRQYEATLKYRHYELQIQGLNNELVQLESSLKLHYEIIIEGIKEQYYGQYGGQPREYQMETADDLGRKI